MLIVILFQFSGAAQKVNYQSISHDNIKSTRVEQNTVCDLIIHSVPKKNCLTSQGKAPWGRGCLTSPWTYYVVFIEPPLRYLPFRVFDYFLQNDDIKTSNSLRRKCVEIGSWLAVLSATVGGGFMVHGHGLLTCYSETTLSSNADHPLFVWQLLSILKSERRSFVLNSRNTDEHFGGNNLLQNIDLSLNNTNSEWLSRGAIEY